MGAGPLTAAATWVAAPEIRVARKEGEARATLASLASSQRGDPAVLLAGMMDLRGSVDLAQRLGERGRDGRGARGRGDAGHGSRGASPSGGAVAFEAKADVKADVKAELAALEASVGRIFAEPFQRRNKLPTPEQMLEVLAATGALKARSGRPVGVAAAQLWEPFGALVTRASSIVRAEASAIREQLAPRLREGSGRLERLERLDAALIRATTAGRAKLAADLLAELGRGFARGLGVAVRALPAEAGLAEVAAWFAPGGFVRGEIARGQAVVMGVLAHERARLTALAEAASTAGALSSGAPSTSTLLSSPVSAAAALGLGPAPDTMKGHGRR